MHILLINTNPVVSRLVSLCVRGVHITLEEVSDIGEIHTDRYDMVFIDEALYQDDTKEFLSNLMIRKKIFLSSNVHIFDEDDFFDLQIKKPFLPSQIKEVLESLEEKDMLVEPEDIPSLFSPSSDMNNEKTDKKNVENVTEILDGSEIEKIKALLEMDEESKTVSLKAYENRKVEVIKEQCITEGLEIVNEDEYIESLSKETKRKTKKPKKKKEEIFTLEETFLAALSSMKVKKIKKLLKNAEITIKINFKDT